jgi:hypothetical protein
MPVNSQLRTENGLGALSVSCKKQKQMKESGAAVCKL